MSESFFVAGQSTALRRLIRSSLEETPWLKLGKDQIDINWQLFFDHCQEQKLTSAFSPHLIAALSKLMPTWSLAMVHSLGFHVNAPAYLERLSTTNDSEPVPLATSLIQCMGKLSSIVEPVFLIVKNHKFHAKTPIRSYAGRQSIDQVWQYFEALRRSCGMRHLVHSWTLNYDLGRRLIVASGDIAMFLHGGIFSENRSETISENHKAKILRYLRRLVRVHDDFYAGFEQSLDSKFSSDLVSLSNSEWSESLRQLAQLEKALSRCLSQGDSYHEIVGGYGISSFKEIFRVFAGDDAENPIELSKTSVFFQRALKAEVSPFGDLLVVCENIAAALKDLQRDLRAEDQLEQIRLFEHSLDDLIATLHRENLSLRQSLVVNLKTEEIEAAIDHLIATSPLLTLIAAGVLSTCPLLHDRDTYGFCLSPWLAANITAKKSLGQLPFTHLGITEAAIDLQDVELGNDEDDASASESDPQHLTGHKVWEAMSRI